MNESAEVRVDPEDGDGTGEDERYQFSMRSRLFALQALLLGLVLITASVGMMNSSQDAELEDGTPSDDGVTSPVNGTNEGYTELRLVEYPEMIEIEQTLDISFEIENHLGSSHNYSYRISGRSGGLVESLDIGWKLIEDGDVVKVAVSEAEFPPPGSLGKVIIEIDTGDEAGFLVRRYEANNFIINPSPGMLAGVWEVSIATERDERLNLACRGLDGGYVFAGSSRQRDENGSIILSDILIVKVDDEGNMAWQRLHSQSDLDFERAYDIVATNDGGYLIAGSNLGRAYTLKIDAEGEKDWEGSWGEDLTSSVRCVAPAGEGFVLAGFTGPTEVSSTQDLYIAKIDQVGGLLWEKTYGGDKHDSAHCITPCREGGFLAAGYSDSFEETGGRLVYLVRFDEDGNLIWQETHGRPFWNEVHDAVQTADGGFIVVGKSCTAAGCSIADAYVLRVDRDGCMIWERFLVGRENSCFTDVLRSDDGSYLLGGYSYVENYGLGEALFIEIDDLGQMIWQTTSEYFSGMMSAPGDDIIVSRPIQSGSDADTVMSRYEILMEGE
jgi:hypothetical protein